MRAAAWRDSFTQAVEGQDQGGDKEALVAQNGPVTLKPLSKGSGTPGLQSCEWAPSRAGHRDRWLS